MKLICDICNARSISSIGEIEGYRAGTFFHVMECAACETNSTLPAESDERIYEAIYNNVAIIPGYARYLNYAKQILKEKNPLQYLMDCEDCYWGIIKTILTGTHGRRTESLIWEIGCGQGYLTYALVKAGFNAIGLDISRTAVASARRRYGNFYFCEEAKDFFKRTKERPSFIVLSEVIEHLPDPISFISELLDYLRPGGAIIVTIPNKAACPSEVIWDTELPPVHLWWFTAKGLEMLGKKLLCRVEFTNLDEFYTENVRLRKIQGDELCQRVPILDKEYRVITRASRETAGSTLSLKLFLKRVLPKRLIRMIRLKKAKLSGLEECVELVPSTLCVTYAALPR